jgi:hypothetical protein
MDNRQNHIEKFKVYLETKIDRYVESKIVQSYHSEGRIREIKQDISDIIQNGQTLILSALELGISKYEMLDYFDIEDVDFWVMEHDSGNCPW